MNKVDIKLNIEGFYELRNEDGVVDFLEEKARSIVSSCSGAYEISTYHGPHRANVSIYTTDSKTFFRNLHNNELLKALK